MSEEQVNEEQQLTDVEKVEQAQNALYGQEPEKETEEKTEEVSESDKTPEEEPAVEKKDEEKESETTSEEDSGEQVEYKLKLGDETLLQDSHVEAVLSFAKENKLSNEQAQEILAQQEEVVSKYVEDQLDAFEAQKDEWREAIVHDPTWGGDNLKQSSEDAKKLVAKFGSDEFVDLLRSTGYGDHPDVFKFLAKVGSLMRSDSLVLSGQSVTQPKTAEELFYGTNN